MKHLIFICSLLLISPLLKSCSDSDSIVVEDEDVTNIDLDLKSEKLIEADNAFGLDLFKEVNTELDEGKNLMISPLSISLALAMVYNGADGDTKSQMETMLHKSGFSPDQINKAYQSLVKALADHDPQVKISIANAIFYDQNFNIKSDFISTNQTYYDAEVDKLDFNNSLSTLDRVNGWVKNKTNNKIEKIIDQVSPTDAIFLMNAIYFKGQWTSQFEKDNTADRAFYTENGNELQVPTMMLDETTLNYTGTSQFQLLELPYGGEKYSMLILLPTEEYSTNDVIAEMNQSNLNNLLENLHERNLKVYLPKFEFAYANSLVDNLKALGMNDAFIASLSDFSGISDIPDLYISEVKHKSYIKVDEEGTEATAVTGVTFEVTSAGPEPVFDVNRPFVFAIREKDTNAILFMGKVNNPLLDE
ncbi:serpin family protein [uncultured Sunxiuqinia sp.]|uniref:serpin family protein n=1 Tax=uncultured Sunxiuqinia sp. TaxID=1573825 RepID=UPI002AA7D15F|nr:serpin family protein [uncultured Sunxiuqinia sp.]